MPSNINDSTSALPNANNGSNNFPGDNFSNNLFTDLAPLLALFGEQMTKQFLSLSLGWADNLLLGMAPVGILTVIVSTIRIGGTRSLKALIGRARESKASAELELLCSTSEEVCELWTGSEIVRVAGEPNMEQYILDTRSASRKIMTTAHAISNGLYERRLRGSRDDPSSLHDNDSEANAYASGPPNITLNVQGAISSTIELWLFVIFGILIQILVFLIGALATYQWQWTSGSQMLSTYGYPCFVGGSIALSCGLIACSRVIQGSTLIEELVPSENTSGNPLYQPLRIQRACTVDDKHFPSFAVFNAVGQPVIRTSRTNGEDFGILTALSAAVAIAGLICQFVGLRALHWSIAVAQLGAIVIMTGARALVRRGLAFQPQCEELPVGNEAAGLAYVLAGVKSWEFVTGAYCEQDSNLPHVRTLVSDYCASNDFEASGSVSGESQVLIRSARSIRKIMSKSDAISALSSQLVRSMTGVITILHKYQENGQLKFDTNDLITDHSWIVQLASMKINGMPEHHTLRLASPTLKLTPPLPHSWATTFGPEVNGLTPLWMSNDTVGAILSLWLVTLKARSTPASTRRIRNDTRAEAGSVRIVYNILDTGAASNRRWLAPETSVLETFMPMGAPDNLPQADLSVVQRAHLQKAPVFGIPFSSLHKRHHLEHETNFTSKKDQDAWLLAEYPNEASTDPSESLTRTLRLLGPSKSNDLFYHQSTTAEHAKDNDFVATRGLKLQEMRTLLNKDFQSSNQKSEFAVISDVSLEKNCALEFFQIFMLSLTTKIQHLGGKTTAVRTQGREDHWQNDILSELASTLTESELANDEAEALTLIVPAFAAHNLLPERPLI